MRSNPLLLLTEYSGTMVRTKNRLRLLPSPRIPRNTGSTLDIGQKWRDQQNSLYLIVIDSEYNIRPQDTSDRRSQINDPPYFKI